MNTKQVQIKVDEQLESFREYLRSNNNEDARRPLLYPLFKKLFAEKFKIESAANGADVYIEGMLLVEAKTESSQWLEGFYQALHYQRKYGLAYHTIMVIANKFVGIWKLDKLPEYATVMSKTANAHKAPNEIGKENAKKTAKHEKIAIQQSAFYWLTPKEIDGDVFAKNITNESYEILKILRNIDSDRQLINTHNFINTIERIKAYFETPIEAVHAFYTIIYFWDITSKVILNENNTEIRVLGYHGNKFSEPLKINPRQTDDFKRFIETQYIFTNEGSGITVDYYFSRFDEVLATIDPEYVKQHGIFFTNNNLSKFSLWFAQKHFPGNINDDYIVFDPAAGSGNLVSSWRGKLKHKIVSELQPDLLKTIERRMQADPFHIENGFTIIPKTTDGIGLNFLDKDAHSYLNILETELKRKNISLNKPLCFLLNPPYKNTDENQTVRDEANAEYTIHPSILEHTGEDAGKERYLAFLSQILNMCKEQHIKHDELKPVVMIFTPTSWLIPRANYIDFRKVWDTHFHFKSGFIVTSNEFFKLQGKWPLAFTIWQYDENLKENNIELFDLTEWKKANLAQLPFDNFEKQNEVDKLLEKVILNEKKVILNNSKGSIKDEINQMQFAFKRDRTKEEKKSNNIIGGLALKDERRNNIKTYGIPNSSFIGLMDDNTPVRVSSDKYGRLSSKPDRIWLQLRPTFIDINLTKIQSCPQDKYGYCAYDIATAKIACSWFAITKALNGTYPVWANQYDIWKPNIKKKYEAEWYALCFGFILAENRCITTKFEKDNPVKNAPEVFVDNPLSPNNKESFWCRTLLPFVKTLNLSTDNPAILLIEAITSFYKYWNMEYCKGQTKENVGLQDEAYFKYFSYLDFVTPNSGLIQIKKFAEVNECVDLLNQLSIIQKLTVAVKKELYRLLVKEFKYFS